MTALDWLRNKATVFQTETLEFDGDTYTVVRYSFSGKIPDKMVFRLKKELKDLVNTELEHEQVFLGHGSSFGECKFYRVVYTKS